MQGGKWHVHYFLENVSLIEQHLLSIKSFDRLQIRYWQQQYVIYVQQQYTPYCHVTKKRDCYGFLFIFVLCGFGLVEQSKSTQQQKRI